MAKNFSLIGKDLQEVTLNDFQGERIVMNIFPSVDTGVCAISVKTFNEKAANLTNTKVLCISRDLPFAQNRFCGAENIENVLTLSDFANGSFGKDYGLTIMDGALANLHSRCIVVLDESHKIIHAEQVDEITSEPNYKSVLAILS
jgi:thiol peroxidase